MVINNAEQYRKALATIEFYLAADPNNPQLFALRPAVEEYETRQERAREHSATYDTIEGQ